MQEHQGEEYASLRSEIDRNSQLTTTVFLATITVTSALIGYGLSSRLGPVFLSPFAVIIPSIFFVTSQLESTTRIDAYVAIFLEPNSPQLNWETRWFELRQKGLLSHTRKYTFSISGLYGTIGAACIALAGIYWDAEWWIFGAIAGPLLCVVLYGILHLRRAFALEFMKQYLDAWSELKQKQK